MTKWKLAYITALAVLAVASLSWTDSFVRLTFKEVTIQSVADILVPVFVAASFLERALEVFIKTWRDLGRKRFEKAEADALQALENAQTPAEEAAAQDALDRAEHELLEYRGETARLAFIAGATAGILIAIAGVRTLWHLIDPTELLPDEAQYNLFNLADIFLTGGLLAGGSDGIHKIMTVITDFLKKLRERINAQ